MTSGKMDNILSQTMLAVGLNADGQVITRQVPIPVPGKGEVLVKIAAAPINPSDLARIRNVAAGDRGTFMAGIEGSGTVVGHGKGLLPRLWMGKRVACSSSHDNCGSWSEYMAVSAMSCVPLPAAISDEQGSMLLVNPLTAIAFFDIIRLQKHKAVINTAAASSLGKFIDLLGKKHGIPVIHIIRNEKQKSELLARSATYVVDSSSDSFEDDLKFFADQLQATLAFDAVGGSLTRQLLLSMPYGSSVVVYGNLSGEQPEMDHRSLVTDNKKVSGFYLVNWLKEKGLITTLISINKVRNLLKSELSITVQARYDLSNPQQAIDSYLSNMTAGKVLFIPEAKK
jgi:NADPH:quinone reductase-like Zn-dependent oxidoreductase